MEDDVDPTFTVDTMEIHFSNSCDIIDTREKAETYLLQWKQYLIKYLDYCNPGIKWKIVDEQLNVNMQHDELFFNIVIKFDKTFIHFDMEKNYSPIK